MITTTLLSAIRHRLGQGGTITARVMTDSMAPVLIPGDLCRVTYEPLTALVPGMILACERSGTMVWHRFLGFRDGTLITKGDRSVQEDEPVLPSAYIGVVTLLRSKRHPSKMREYASKVLRAFRAYISELLVAGKDIRLLRYCWSYYLDVVLYIVQRSLKSLPYVHLIHVHSRYLQKDIIAGSSDVDLTVILKAQPDPQVRRYMYAFVMNKALRLAQLLPCFDPPFLFFEDELKDITATSIFFAQSLGTQAEPHAFSRAIGLLDELYALIRRYNRLVEARPAGAHFSYKRTVELTKIYADITQLASFCDDTEAHRYPLPQKRVVPQISIDALASIVYSKLLELSARILNMPEIQRPMPLDRHLRSFPEHCLAVYRDIPLSKRPVTLHMAQFLRGLQEFS